MTLLETLNQNIPLDFYPELFLRITVACVCGAIIGFERTKRQKAAGIRTHCLIAATSALMMILSKYAFADLDKTLSALYESSRGADPSRIASQIVSGVSFLGAGVIFVKGGSVKGLTTAAGIWATCAIGMAVGSGMYLLAGFTTILVVILQVILHCLNVGDDAFSTHEMVVEMEDKPSLRLALDELFDCYAVTVLNSRVTKENGLLLLKLSVRMKKNINFEEIVRFVDEHPGIRTLEM